MRPMSFDFHSRRSMVTARRGIISSNNPLASAAGLDILRRGGTAADAAVAALAVLCVTDPASTGIGGDCFALYYDAHSGALTALNGSGRAPAALTAAHFGTASTISVRSPLAVTVPGAVRAWQDLLARHGRMTLRQVLADAIHHASEGYPVAPVFGASWAASTDFLRNSPHTEQYLPNGNAPQVGQIVRLPDLARTLQAIADGGADAFYQGPTAQAIVNTLQALGGVLTMQDLAAHQSLWETPIHTTYRGVTVYECPPNGQGLAALIALQILEQFSDVFASTDWHDPARLHIMVEAMRLAFADARQYIADPQMNEAAVLAALTHKTYALERSRLIQWGKAMQPPAFGVPLRGSDTVYLCAVDGEGNACSLINSLYMGFGTGIVAQGTGVFLQNRGACFDLAAGHPNIVAGGKRPYHTIIPGMALRDGQLWAAFGVMGGYMQPQGHVQVLSAMLDDEFNPQEALDRPRWCLEDGRGDSMLAVEEGLPFKTLARLSELGHRLRPVSGRARGVFGDGHIIRRDADTGVLYGGCDPRKDGVVIGY
jgi:gamma-glutamyltranspeptidase / glutathione hydrolase